TTHVHTPVAGGSGNTRLSMQFAAELADVFADVVFFVSLAPVREPALVGPTILQAVGVSDFGDLREADALLVLDNFEHLLTAAGDLPTLLADAPGLKLLTACRVRLRVSGETGS